jgi:hypothetical protein
MKLNCWIGPLISVIILLTLRQMVYNATENKQQQSAVTASVEKKEPVLSPPVASTLMVRDTLPF